MKLGLDCPTSWLECIQPYADYDYVLVEKCLTDEVYLNYFKNSSREKLLNNRLMGADMPRTLEDIVQVWDILGGMVIAPDWGNEHIKTVMGYKEICKEIPKENIIGVVQTIDSYEVEDLLEIYGDKVAVGFDVGSEHEDGEVDKVRRRVGVVTYLKGKDKKVHLLGMTHPGELLFYKNLGYVESINTGLPVLLGFKGMNLFGYKRIKDVSSYNYMDMDNPSFDPHIYNLIKDNLTNLRMLL